MAEEKKIRVLVIDDENDFRQLMAFWLKTKGYTVVTAGGGEEALKIIKEDAPEILFLDLCMPGMDGVEVLKKLRKFNKDLPVIIISAYIDRQRVTELTPYGISGVFYKGKEFEEGLALLETALKMHKKLKK